MFISKPHNSLVIGVIVICLISSNLFAQDSLSVESKLVDDNPYEKSLKKGMMFLGLGVNLFTNNTKNQDRFVNYVLDESDRNFNLKLIYGYFIKDTHPVGVSFKYVTNELNTTYQSLLGDTILYKEISNDYIFNAYYGVTKQLFGSQRIYFISDPGIFFTGGNTRSDRSDSDGALDDSKTIRNEVALGLNVGILFFLWPNMAVSGSVGPVGIGYQWETYYVNGEANGESSDFFIRMSPDILRLQIGISRYF